MTNTQIAKIVVEELERQGIVVTLETILNDLDFSRQDESTEVDLSVIVNNFAQKYETNFQDSNIEKKVKVKTDWTFADGTVTEIEISRSDIGTWSVIDLETGDDLQDEWEPKDFKEFTQLFEEFED